MSDTMSSAAYCRTCACRAEGFHRLRTFALPSPAADSLLALVRSVHAGVSRGDGLPQNVCSQCLNRLRSTHNFICKVREAQDLLASIFSKDPDMGPKKFMWNTTTKEEPNKTAVYMTKDLSSDEMADTSTLYKFDAKEKEINNGSHGADGTQANGQNDKVITAPDYDIKDFKNVKVEFPVESECCSEEKCTSDGNLDDSDSTSEQKPSVKYEEVKIECTEITKLKTNSNIKALTKDDNWEQSNVFLKTNTAAVINAEVSHDTITSLIKQSPARDDEDEVSFKTGTCNTMPKTSIYLPKDSINTSLSTWKDYLRCKRCNKTTETVQQLLDHSMEEHTSCMPFKCYKCSVNIVSRHRFFQHIYKHDNTLIQCCEYCGERFVSDSDAIWHKEIKHTVKNKTFECRLCDTGFDTNGELMCHQDTFIRGRKRPSVCDHCKKEFTFKCRLIEHMECHYPSKHICKICNNTFKSKNILRTHHNVHYPKVHHVCELCGKGFRYKSQYTAHLTTHSDAKPHECDHKQFHDPPLFKCDVCSKEFRFQSCLRTHLRVHTNEKPHSCVMCNKNFATWSNFNKHMKRIHDRNMAKTKFTNITSPK